MGKLENLPAKSHDKTYVVHLMDGSMVLFAEGFEVRDNALVGRGTKYDLTRTEFGSVWMVPGDSVALVLRYHEEVQTLQSVTMSLAVVLAYGALSAVLLSLALRGH